MSETERKPAETGPEGEEHVRKVYGEIAEAYEVLFPSLHRYEGRVERFLDATVEPDDRVLDMGCGPGLLTRHLEPSVRVLGLDLSREMLELARRGRPSGEYRVHSYREPLPVELGHFDVELAVGCLDFCNDLTGALRNLSAALAPEGRLLFTVLERRPGLEGHEDSWRLIQTAGPSVMLYFWSFTETAQALAAAELVPVRYEHAPGWVHLVDQRTMHFGWWEVRRR